MSEARNRLQINLEALTLTHMRFSHVPWLHGAGLLASTFAASTAVAWADGDSASPQGHPPLRWSEAGDPGSLAAAVGELHARVRHVSPPGLDRLVHFYGGSAELVLRGVLRSTAGKGAKGGAEKFDTAAAYEQLLRTLAFRAEQSLDRPCDDVLLAIDTAPCRSFWPFAFAETAPDGSPVVSGTETRRRRSCAQYLI